VIIQSTTLGLILLQSVITFPKNDIIDKSDSMQLETKSQTAPCPEVKSTEPQTLAKL